MRTQIAEGILSLVLTPDRAASTVGDWMEETPRRGLRWFWSSVFRTVFARIWSDFTDQPLTMARLGLTGFARNFAVAFGIFILFQWLLHGDIRYRHDWIWKMLTVDHAKAHLSLRWQMQLAVWLLYSARLMLTARWIARSSGGREMAACISVAFAGWMAILVVLEYSPARLTPEAYLLFFANDIILCTAAIWMRRRAFPTPGMG